jgi:hypothetical protein
MAKIQKIPKVIKAFQLISGEPWPPGVAWNEKTRQIYVTTIQGVDVPIQYGEWVMPEGDGIHFYPCADSILRSTYEFLDDEPAAVPEPTTLADWQSFEGAYLSDPAPDNTIVKKLEDWQVLEGAYLAGLVADNTATSVEKLEAWQPKFAAWLDAQVVTPPPPTPGHVPLPKTRMGIHLIGNREGDLYYAERLRPAAIKIVDPDPTVVRRMLNAIDPNGVVILRDHPLSEQKSDMAADPVGTGKRHALDWIQKLTSGRFAEFNGDKRIVVVGINEPDVHNADEEAIVFQYTKIFLETLTAAGVRGLALNLSVGWPRNNGSDTPPVWDTFLPLENIILKGNHFLCTHEYWLPNPQDKWGWYGNRISKCPMSVPVIIGECAYTRQLAANQPQPWGWIGNMSAPAYAEQLMWYHDNVDPNVFAILPFTSGFASSEWASKDIMPASADILARVHAYPWPATWPVPKVPPVVTPPVPPDPTPEAWQIGDLVKALTTVNIRQAPGYSGLVVGRLTNGEQAEIVGGPVAANGLIWWQTAAGWMAQSVDGVPLLAKTFRLRYPFDGVYRVTQNFGENPQDYARFGLKGHNGIDFACPTGTRILAAADGIAREVLFDAGGFGFYAKLIHVWGETICAHFSQQVLTQGQMVRAGDLIGISGSTGNSTGAHLHFGMRVNPYVRTDGWQGYVNPAPFLPKMGQG